MFWAVNASDVFRRQVLRRIAEDLRLGGVRLTDQSVGAFSGLSDGRRAQPAAISYPPPMELSGRDELVLSALLAAVAGDRRSARPPCSVPDPARARRARAGLHSRRPRADLALGARPRRDPAAASVLRRILHGAAGASGEPAADLTARGRPRRRHDARSRGRRPRRHGSELGRLLRPRRDRLADRPHRGDGDRPAVRRPAANRLDRGGREPRQRRHGARRPLRRGRHRGRLGELLDLERGLRLRRERGRRDRRRPRGRVGRRARADPARQHPGRDPDRPALRLPRLHPRPSARSLRCPCRRHDRRLPGLARSRAVDAGHADPGAGGLRDARLRRQRAPLHADRAAAESHSRRARQRVRAGI